MKRRGTAKSFFVVVLGISLATAIFCTTDPRFQFGLTITFCSFFLAGFLLVIRTNDAVTVPAKSFGLGDPNIGGPGIFVCILFLLLLSGPPMFRSRDPLASLRGDFDGIVILHIIVWGIAGLWVVYRLQTERGWRLELGYGQKLGLAMIFILGASVFVSPGPGLTAFKVYQMLVSLLFGFVFVRQYGIRQSLDKLLLGYTILCVFTAVLTFVAPDVLLNGLWNAARFRIRGDLFVPTGTVSVLGIALLLTNPPKVSKPIFLAMLALFLILLIFSFTRTAYIALFVFLALAIVRRPNSPALRRFIYTTMAVVPLLLVSGLMPLVISGIVREPKSIEDLSGREELWTHLVDVLMQDSPFGLGYNAAARIHSLEFLSNAGTAHSAFVEVLIGGGIVAFLFFVLLCCALFGDALALLYRGKDPVSFAVACLLPMVLLLAATGWGEFDSGPAALTFWCLAAMLPQLRRSRTPEITARMPDCTYSSEPVGNPSTVHP